MSDADDEIQIDGLSRTSWLGAGSGVVGVATAVLIGGLVFHLTINGVDYVRAASGVLASLLAAVGLLLALRARRFARAGIASLVALGGLAQFALSGVLGVVLAGGLFGPSVDDVRENLERGGELTDVHVVARGDGRFDFTGRRGHDRCEGSIGVHGSSTTSTRSCHLPTELPELEAACRDRVAAACALAVRRVRETEPIDWPHLNVLTDLGCQLDQPGACFYLGVAREHGNGGPVDMTAALVAFERGCLHGSNDACWNAGLQRFHGRGTPADPAAANALWRQACDRGSLACCERLGEGLRDGAGAPRDVAAARELFQRACDGSVGAACTNLAALHLDGLLGAANAAAALPLYERGCDLRSGVGCNNAGLLLQRGNGTNADPLRAKALFARGCDELEEGGSCVGSGMLLHAGAPGVPRDRVAALARFERACTLRRSDGCRNVAIYHRDGTAGPRDVERARTFFRQSCELGEARACREINF